MKRAGHEPTEAIGDETMKGLTVQPLPQGDISEVYWNRTTLLRDVCSAVFHEAAHLKSRDETMHSSVIDGEPVRILSKRINSSVFLPNLADIRFFTAAIPKVRMLRNRLP